MKLEPAKERLDAPTFTAVRIPRSEVAIAGGGVSDRWLVGWSYSWVEKVKLNGGLLKQQ